MFAFQADAVLQGDAGEVVPSVQCDEDGPRPPWTPLSYRTAERQRAGVCRVRHLQRGAGQYTQIKSKDT